MSFGQAAVTAQNQSSGEVYAITTVTGASMLADFTLQGKRRLDSV